MEVEEVMEVDLYFLLYLLSFSAAPSLHLHSSFSGLLTPAGHQSGLTLVGNLLEVLALKEEYL